MMLDTILDYLRNDFCINAVEGEYTISGEELSLPEAMNGQYIRIVGSVLNDGVYKVEENKVAGLSDEVFTGSIRYLAIPKALIELLPKIEEWEEKSLASPFQSESFADYKYDKGGSVTQTSWQKAFGKTLRIWRKL